MDHYVTQNKDDACEDCVNDNSCNQDVSKHPENFSYSAALSNVHPLMPWDLQCPITIWVLLHQSNVMTFNYVGLI